MSKRSPRFGASPVELLNDHRVTSGRVIAVYLALHSHVQGMEGECWPSRERLAELSHNSLSTTTRCLDELIELGYVSKVNRPGTSNLYDVRWSADTRSNMNRPTQSNMNRGGVHIEPTTRFNMNHEEEPVEEEPLNNTLSPEGEEVALVESELGATLISEEREEDLSPKNQDGVKGEGQPTQPTSSLASNPEEKILSLSEISARARTDQRVPLTREFLPSKVGYTSQHFAQQFPGLNPRETLERFLSHHLAKGDSSMNWLESFLSFAAEGQRRANATKTTNTGVETDSLGYPTDRAERIRRRRAEEAFFAPEKEGDQ